VIILLNARQASMLLPMDAANAGRGTGAMSTTAVRLGSCSEALAGEALAGRGDLAMVRSGLARH
jgi:hypothetical protein